MSRPAPDHIADRLWDVDDVSAFLGVPVRTLYPSRYHRSGPPSCRVGRHVRYVPAAVRAWVDEQTAISEAGLTRGR